MEVKTFILKSCTNLLLKSSKFNPQQDDQKNQYRKQSNLANVTLNKPDFKLCLDHLGPLVCYFYGIDQEKGILIGDETHAITCHLRPEALKQFRQQNIEALIGTKVIINQNGTKVDQDEIEKKQKAYKNIKVNPQKAAKNVVLKICLKREKKQTNYKGTFNQEQNEQELSQSFKFIIRLDISDIFFVPEDDNAERLVIAQRPKYIEHDQNLTILFQSKFIHQQRFELEKSILQNSAQEVTDLEDLFESSLFLTDEKCESNQAIEVRAINLTREMLQFGFEKVTKIDQEMIDGLESSQEQAKEETIPSKTRSQKAIKQIFNSAKNLCQVNRRIFLSDSLDIESEKNELADMLVQETNLDEGIMGVNAQENQNSFAQQVARRREEIDSQEDLLNALEESDSEKLQFDYSEQSVESAGMPDEEFVKYLNGRKMTVSLYKEYMKFFKKHNVIKNQPVVEDSKTQEEPSRAYIKSQKPSPLPLPVNAPSVSQKLKDLARLRQSRMSSNAVENIENSQSENIQNKKRTYEESQCSEIEEIEAPKYRKADEQKIECIIIEKPKEVQVKSKKKTKKLQFL